MASQIVNLKAAGLQTNYQSLMDISPGALLQANNTVINRSGVIESRRGFKAYGPSFGLETDRAKQLFQYRNTLIRHVGNKLAFDNGSGTFTDFSGTYVEPTSGYRIKSATDKSNIYFTTSSGVKKISETSSTNITTNSISDAGVPKALGGSGRAISPDQTYIVYDLSSSGFFPESIVDKTADYYVSYRVLWSLTDKNDNLLLGSPSERILVANVSKKEKYSVELIIDIPDNITTDYKCRVYRSEVAQNSSPSDELYFVYEKNPTTSEITSKKLTYIDQVSEIVRLSGVPLYTNQYTGDGILSGNEPPPNAADISLFSGHMFYSNTSLKHYLDFELINSIPSFTSQGVPVTGGLSITDSGGARIYTIQGSREATRFVLPASGIGSNFNRIYLTLYSANDERRYWMEILNTSASVFIDPLFPEEELTKWIILPSITVNNLNSASSINGQIKSVLLANSNAVYDFDIFITTTTNTEDTLNIVSNANGVCTDSNITSSGVSKSRLQGIGEDVATRKILNSNGWSPTTNTSGCSWTLNSTTINCPAGTLGFSVGQKIYGQFAKYLEYASTASFPATPDTSTIYFARNTNTYYRALPDNTYVSRNDGILSTYETRVITSITSNTIVVDSSIGNAVSAGIPSKMIYQIDSSNKYAIELTTKSIAKVINQDTSISISCFNLASADSPGKILLERPLFSDEEFTVSGSAEYFNPKLESKKSSNEKVKNRIYYSKYLQPEAVPILNYIDVGSKDFEISRILSSRDSVFIFKRDGIYRLTGSAGNDPVWDVSVYDNTVVLIAPDSLVLLANDCYFLSNQGYVKLNETAMSYISTAIDNKILPFLTSSYISTASFCVSYETERSLLAWTISSKNDQYATVCYRYNLLTQTWTEWKIEKTCGIIQYFQDKLYLGSAKDNYIEVERKDFNRFDYADRELSSQITADSLVDSTLKLNIYNLAGEGDIVTQLQYVTLYQFNSFLKKLDLDNGLDFHDFYNDFKLNPGEDLTVKMTSVVDRLNLADPTVNYSLLWTSPLDFSVIQTQFNNIILALNNSTKTEFSNYKSSNGTVIYETRIIEVNRINKVIQLYNSPKFIIGPVLLYKSIPTEIEYAPQHAGDVTGYKQFSLGSFLFERRSFQTAKIAYNSDISSNYEEIPINLESQASYGTVSWGQDFTWGGEGDQALVNTYVPLKKQKCTFLGCKFIHNVAFENYQLYGLSLTVRLFTVPGRNYKS